MSVIKLILKAIGVLAVAGAMIGPACYAMRRVLRDSIRQASASQRRRMKLTLLADAVFAVIVIVVIVVASR